MGVDATMFVVADYSRDDRFYGAATIALCRDYDLWGKLNALPERGCTKRIQLPRASWACRSDGSGRDYEHEGGYLFGDSYNPDGGFVLYSVDDLAGVEAEHTNGKILRFVRETYPGHRFLIIWH